MASLHSRALSPLLWGHLHILLHQRRSFFSRLALRLPYGVLCLLSNHERVGKAEDVLSCPCFEL
jgi:hypothetical protein